MVAMNVVRFHRKGPPAVLTYEQVDRPVPQVGEMLARIIVTGVNYADVMRRKGDNYPAPSPLPYTLGGEAVAVIEAAGPGGDRAIVGKLAIIFPGAGCYADYAVVPASRIYPIPEGIDPEHAIALFVQGLSAAFILKYSSRLQPGEIVLVQGAAGGVGTLAVQLAKVYGASMVIGAASTDTKRNLVRALGADLAIDYGAPGWDDEVRAYTGGRGVDIVLEITGGEVARRSMALLAPFGRSIVFGATSEENWVLDTQALPPRNLSISGFWLRSYLDRPDLITATLREFGTLIAEGRLKVQLGGRYPLSQAAAAHAALENRDTSGKLVLIPDGIFEA